MCVTRRRHSAPRAAPGVAPRQHRVAPSSRSAVPCPPRDGGGARPKDARRTRRRPTPWSGGCPEPCAGKHGACSRPRSASFAVVRGAPTAAAVDGGVRGEVGCRAVAPGLWTGSLRLPVRAAGSRRRHRACRCPQRSVCSPAACLTLRDGRGRVPRSAARRGAANRGATLAPGKADRVVCGLVRPCPLVSYPRDIVRMATSILPPTARRAAGDR